MTYLDWIGAAGAVATTAMGGLGLAAPRVCAKLVGLRATSLAGFAEFRATYGGVFLVLGLGPLATSSPDIFLMSGLAWLAAAAGRILSIVVDGTFDSPNVRAVIVEFAFAISLVAGAAGFS